MRALGKTGLSIAPIVFGGNVFGWTVEKASFNILVDVYFARVPGFGPEVDDAARAAAKVYAAEAACRCADLVNEAPVPRRRGRIHKENADREVGTWSGETGALPS
jgi:hypothetical protein